MIPTRTGSDLSFGSLCSAMDTVSKVCAAEAFELGVFIAYLPSGCLQNKRRTDPVCSRMSAYTPFTRPVRPTRPELPPNLARGQETPKRNSVNPLVAAQDRQLQMMDSVLCAEVG
jgi:hypothetical protein